MKRIIRKFLPERIRAKIKTSILMPMLIVYVFKRWLIIAFNGHNKTWFSLRRLIHRLDKNVTMPNRIQMSGLDTALDILYLTESLNSDGLLDKETETWLYCVITKYRDLLETDLVQSKQNNLNESVQKARLIIKKIDYYFNNAEKEGCSFELISQLLPSGYDALSSISKSRVSVRKFRDETISGDTVLRALDIAKDYPSACNRQAVSITIIRDNEKQKKILEIQGGLRGYPSSIPLLTIVHFSRSAFPGFHERHTGYIECGLFAMGYIYGLQAQGVYSVPLNWSFRIGSTDSKLRQLARLKIEDEVAFLIAAGFPDEKFNVPMSFRKPIERFIREI